MIATPLLLLMLLVIIQFALWSHATHTAQAAASQGLAAARAQDGTAAAGSASAQQMLDQLDSGPLTGASVNTDRTATSVVPFLRLAGDGGQPGRAQTGALWRRKSRW